MHLTKPVPLAYRLSARDGETYHLSDFSELLRLFGGRIRLRAALARFGTAFSGHDPLSVALGVPDIFWVLRDWAGDPVAPAAIADWLGETAPLRPWHVVPPHVFRRGPVPKTGKRRWGGSLRYPATTQERRNDCAFALDEVEALEAGCNLKRRAGRRAKTLVSAWDDLWRDPERNWKSQRRRQWKA